MLAIHYDTNKINFCHSWIKYCQKFQIPFKLVNCLDPNFIKEMKQFNGLLWQWHQGDYTYDVNANKLLTLIEKYLGKPVFPNFETRWHFDDKLIENLLFDIFEIKTPKFWYFFDKKTAIEWSENVNYPIVFKLRKGASSENVKLIKNRKSCQKIIEKMFSQGIPPSTLQMRTMIKKRGFLGLIRTVKITGWKRIFQVIQNKRRYSKEKGYVYFQEYIPNCEYDIRVLIVCGKAYAFRRFVREDDFRASGSGKIDFNLDKISLGVIKSSFEVYKKIKPQSLALDFLETKDEFFLLEMSYAFVNDVKPIWPGYWDENLIWHEESIDPLGLIVEEVLNGEKK